MNMPMDNDARCLIIGAGICGLMAARVLNEAGVPVTLIERENHVGGRVVTSFTAEGGAFDEGAQVLTVSDPSLDRWVHEWLELHLIEEWQPPVSTSADPPHQIKGHRYRGKGGMGMITSHMAEGLDILLGEAVERIEIKPQGGWVVHTAGRGPFQGRSLTLTPPVPISLKLIDEGHVLLPPQVRRELEAVQYAASITLMLRLAGHSAIPENGISPKGGEPIVWMVDNRKKGLSRQLDCVTIQGGPQFSKRHIQNDDEVIQNLLIEAAAPYLGSDVLECRIRRWPYSIATHVYPEPCLLVPGAAPLVMAGDGFGGPGIEGAALSGLMAADRLLNLK